jgi:hypothetical protein
MTPMTSSPARQPFSDRLNQASGWMPLFWISFTFLAGILLASLFQIPLLAWWAVAGFFFLLFILLVIASKKNGLSRQIPVVNSAVLWMLCNCFLLFARLVE